MSCTRRPSGCATTTSSGWSRPSTSTARSAATSRRCSTTWRPRSGAAMVSGAVIVLVLSLHGARVPAQLVRRNLSNAATRSTDLRTVVLQRPARERVVKPAVARLAGAARHLTPHGMLDTLEGRVNQAGVSEGWPLDRVLATKLGLGAAGALLGVVRFVVEPSGVALLLGAAAAVIG